MKIPLGLLALVASFASIGCTPTTYKTESHAYTPSSGHQERTEIIAAATRSFAQQGVNVIVNVPYLKVHDGWAWIQVNPQSPDGSQNYKPQSGLLEELPTKNWTLLEWMPAEEGADTRAYFAKLKRRYPEAPGDIFAN